MHRFAFFGLVVFLGCAPAAPPAPVAPATPPATDVIANGAANATPTLRRGMNLGNALDAPSEGAWGVTLDASDFVAVHRAGFDHVRLPARFSAHAADSPPYAIDASFSARVDWSIDQALTNGLAIILDMHHEEEMMASPDTERVRFLGLWKQIAEHYKNEPRWVVFELLNEPSGALSAPTWNGILSEALRVVRASNPTRLVVIEGINWASARSLSDTLVVPEGDTNLIGSFHMYQPILFTHQGADWMGPSFQTPGIIFPGPPGTPIRPADSAIAESWVRNWFTLYNTLPADRNPSGPSAIANELDVAATFAKAHHLPVYMGEFGAIDHADPRSRALWTRMTRVEAERRGFGWAYWDDGSSFKVYDRATRNWEPSIRSALLE